MSISHTIDVIIPMVETTLTTYLAFEVNIATNSKAFAAQKIPKILQLT